MPEASGRLRKRWPPANIPGVAHLKIVIAVSSPDAGWSDGMSGGCDADDYWANGRASPEPIACCTGSRSRI